MVQQIIELQDLINEKYAHNPTGWRDRVVDTEGDRSDPGVKFSAKRGNNLETSAVKAHERVNHVVDYLEDSDRTQKNLRFEFLLLKASVTSGLTSNIFVDNFESLSGIDLIAGAHNPELQRIYLP